MEKSELKRCLWCDIRLEAWAEHHADSIIDRVWFSVGEGNRALRAMPKFSIDDVQVLAAQPEKIRNVTCLLDDSSFHFWRKNRRTFKFDKFNMA